MAMDTLEPKGTSEIDPGRGSEICINVPQAASLPEAPPLTSTGSLVGWGSGEPGNADLSSGLRVWLWEREGLQV